jgi:hypothetical protein
LPQKKLKKPTIDRISTIVLVQEHSRLDESLRGPNRISDKNKVQRLRIKDELTKRAQQGDSDAMAYAVKRRWEVLMKAAE